MACLHRRQPLHLRWRTAQPATSPCAGCSHPGGQPAAGHLGAHDTAAASQAAGSARLPATLPGPVRAVHSPSPGGGGALWRRCCRAPGGVSQAQRQPLSWMMQVFMATFCWLQPKMPGLNEHCSKAVDVLLLGLADLHACLLSISLQRLVLASEFRCLRQLHPDLSVQLDISKLSST